MREEKSVPPLAPPLRPPYLAGVGERGGLGGGQCGWGMVGGALDGTLPPVPPRAVRGLYNGGLDHDALDLLHLPAPLHQELRLFQQPLPAGPLLGPRGGGPKIGSKIGPTIGPKTAPKFVPQIEHQNVSQMGEKYKIILQILRERPSDLRLP